MKGIIVLGGLLASVVAAPVYAGYGKEPGCCACVLQNETVHTFFCASPVGEAEQEAAQQQCDAIPNALLQCLLRERVADNVTAECVSALREEGILCPLETSAPTVGHVALGALALLLGTAGAVTLRRRA